VIAETINSRKKEGGAAVIQKKRGKKGTDLAGYGSKSNTGGKGKVKPAKRETPTM